MPRNIPMPRMIVSVRVLAAVALALLAVSWVGPSSALAHERRTVSGYDLVVGFFVEPALEGEKNGLDLRITKAGANVEGAEKTLKWDITHVQSGGTRTYPVRALFGMPGRYTADVIPTLTGQVRFRIYGTIEGTAIDATFVSGPGTFGNVEPVTELQFPVAAAQPRELQGALEAARDEAQAANDAARSARTLAIAGIALGAAGLAAGGAAAVRSRRA